MRGAICRSSASGGLTTDDTDREAVSDGGIGEESAEQSAGVQFLEPGVPRFRACAETFEDPSQLGRDRGFGVAEEPAGVIDQEQVGMVRTSHAEPGTKVTIRVGDGQAPIVATVSEMPVLARG